MRSVAPSEIVRQRAKRRATAPPPTLAFDPVLIAEKLGVAPVERVGRDEFADLDRDLRNGVLGRVQTAP